jgi:hypothetical protein
MVTNPYMTTVNPYMQGNAQAPVMAPNAMQGMQNQQLLAQQNALVNQAGQSQVGGASPQMMASMLRGGGKGSDLMNMAKTALGSKYDTDMGSEQSRMLAMQERGMYGS